LELAAHGGGIISGEFYTSAVRMRGKERRRDKRTSEERDNPEIEDCGASADGEAEKTRIQFPGKDPPLRFEELDIQIGTGVRMKDRHGG
jgi:hypothetical protein